jgi:hypothetical protein
LFILHSSVFIPHSSFFILHWNSCPLQLLSIATVRCVDCVLIVFIGTRVDGNTAIRYLVFGLAALILEQKISLVLGRCPGLPIATGRYVV